MHYGPHMDRMTSSLPSTKYLSNIWSNKAIIRHYIITHASHTIHTHKTYTTHNIQSTLYMKHILYTLTKHILYLQQMDGLHRTHTLDYIHSSDIEYILHTPYQCTQQTHLHNRLILHIYRTLMLYTQKTNSRHTYRIHNIFIRVQAIYTEHML